MLNSSTLFLVHGGSVIAYPHSLGDASLAVGLIIAMMMFVVVVLIGRCLPGQESL